VLKTLNDLGGGLSITSKDVEGLKAELAELKTLNLCILMALQHLWGQNPAISKWAGDNGFNTNGTVVAFRDWLSRALPR
jgi:hypothetical protein